MFPPAHDPSRPAVRSVRSAIRNAADLAIAFMTLEGYGLDDLRPARIPRGGSHPGSPDDAAASPSTSSGSRAAAGRELPPAPRTQLASSQQPLDVQHPRRSGLRSSARSRRPGVVPASEQHCLTPLARTGTVTDPVSPSPRRRTAAQDTPH